LGLHEDINTIKGKPKFRELDGDLDKQTLQEIVKEN
jgi:hypothetical protein